MIFKLYRTLRRWSAAYNVIQVMKAMPECPICKKTPDSHAEWCWLNMVR